MQREPAVKSKNKIIFWTWNNIRGKIGTTYGVVLLKDNKPEKLEFCPGTKLEVKKDFQVLEPG